MICQTFQWWHFSMSRVTLKQNRPLRFITSNPQGPLGASFHIKQYVPTEMMILYAFGFRIQKDPGSSWILRIYQIGGGEFYWCQVEKSLSTRWEWKLCSDCLPWTKTSKESDIMRLILNKFKHSTIWMEESFLV